MTSASGEAVRGAICRYVRENPGVHFRELQRRLELGPGQAVHHLRRLVADGVLAGHHHGGYTHYYASGAPRPARPAQAVLRQRTRRAIAAELRERGGLTLQELASATGCAKSTLHHHLRILAGAGVLRVEGPRPARYALTPEASEALAPAVPVHEELLALAAAAG